MPSPSAARPRGHLMRHVTILRLVALCLVAACLTLSPGSRALAASADSTAKPTKSEQARALLHDRDFEALEALLPTSEGEAASRKGGSLNLFYAFNNANPKNEGSLSKWVEQRPTSAVAWLARGIYFTHLGLVARGGYLTSKTTPLRLGMMHEYFDLARMDLAQALKLDSYLDIAYARLMTIEKFGGLHERYVAIGDKALAVLADPYEIHWSQLSFIRPKWNRPIRELHDRLATLQRDYGDDPRYSYLKGYIEYVEADFQYWEGKYDQALTTIEKAIADAPLSDRYIRKAYILLKLHRHEDALESIDKALDISSDDADYNFLKGSTLRRYFYWGGEYRSRVEEAEEFYDRAVASDSFNPDYLLKRADYYLMRARGYARPKHVAQRLGYQRRAIEDLFDAARVGDQFPEVNIETAKFLCIT